jgi:hypothetical protein
MDLCVVPKYAEMEVNQHFGKTTLAPSEKHHIWIQTN